MQVNYMTDLGICWLPFSWLCREGILRASNLRTFSKLQLEASKGPAPQTTISCSLEESRVVKDISMKNYMESVSTITNSHYAMVFSGGIMAKRMFASTWHHNGS